MTALLSSFLERDVGALTQVELVQIHHLLFENGQYRAGVNERAERWWSDQGGQKSETIRNVLNELAEQIAAVSADDLDPNLISLIICEEL